MISDPAFSELRCFGFVSLGCCASLMLSFSFSPAKLRKEAVQVTFAPPPPRPGPQIHSNLGGLTFCLGRDVSYQNISGPHPILKIKGVGMIILAPSFRGFLLELLPSLRPLTTSTFTSLQLDRGWLYRHKKRIHYPFSSFPIGIDLGWAHRKLKKVTRTTKNPPPTFSHTPTADTSGLQG